MSVVLLLLALGAATGCGSVQAPLGPDGKPLVIELLVDPGLEGHDDIGQGQLTELGGYLTRDITERLADAGYEVAQLSSAEASTTGPGRYLLAIDIIDYNPGSKAARVLVGFGAGSASLDLHYELSGESPPPLISKDHGRASSKDWDDIVRRLDEDIVVHVTDVLTARH
jgi:hypothetical protein